MLGGGGGHVSLSPCRTVSLLSPQCQIQGEWLPQQGWRRRTKCAGMEQAVPVSQERFNLPLVYKQQMFVQLTCKRAARGMAPTQLLRVSCPLMGRGDRAQPSPGPVRLHGAWWLEPGVMLGRKGRMWPAAVAARRAPTLHSHLHIPSARLGTTAPAQGSHSSQP